MWENFGLHAIFKTPSKPNAKSKADSKIHILPTNTTTLPLR
ncbi:hypothetical protein [uncultured Helicobacter sp.]